MRTLRCGEHAILCEVGDLAEVSALRAAITSARSNGRLPSVVDVVPAARTVLVTIRPDSADLAAVRDVLSGLDLSGAAASQRIGARITVAVHYGGPDLELVADTAGISVDEVISAHSGAEYEVAFCGFMPGFGYLSGLPANLRQPRLDQPRTRVPPGSVAIADEYTAIYPGASPGGWRLIGRTELVVFDARRDPPALFAPGDRVRFEVIR